MRLPSLVLLLPAALLLRPAPDSGPSQGPVELLPCDTCSPQVDLNGYYAVGPYRTPQAAQTAVDNWSAFTAMLAGVLSNFACDSCPIPMLDCAKIGMTDGHGMPEYWIVGLPTGIYVIYNIEGEHAWVCCASCDH